MIQITNDKGIKFNVRLIEKGDSYGVNGCRRHNEDDPLVEFYEARHPHIEHGWFISRYYLSTFFGRDLLDGINLEGGVPDWQLDGQTLMEAVDYCRNKHAFNLWKAS